MCNRTLTERVKQMKLTTQAQVRLCFWESLPEGLCRRDEMRIKRQRPENDFRTDVRCMFVDYVDALHKDGRISDALAHRVTLT